MKSLLLSPRYTIDSRLLAKEARVIGWAVRRLNDRQAPAGLAAEECVLYGESFFVEYMAQELNIRLAVPKSDFLVTLPENCVKRQIDLLTFKNFRPLSIPMFVKAADIKSIQAKVYEPHETILGLEALSPETPLLVSEPVQWQVEYRCFVANRVLRAMSIYVDDGEVVRQFDTDWQVTSDRDQAAVAFIESLLCDSRVDLPEAVVIDIGLIAGRGWAVVEANPAWASGIYGCEPRGVLMTLAAAMRPI